MYNSYFKCSKFNFIIVAFLNENWNIIIITNNI